MSQTVKTWYQVLVLSGLLVMCSFSAYAFSLGEPKSDGMLDSGYQYQDTGGGFNPYNSSGDYQTTSDSYEGSGGAIFDVSDLLTGGSGGLLGEILGAFGIEGCGTGLFDSDGVNRRRGWRIGSLFSSDSCMAGIIREIAGDDVPILTTDVIITVSSDGGRPQIDFDDSTYGSGRMGAALRKQLEKGDSAGALQEAQDSKAGHGTPLPVLRQTPAAGERIHI